MNRILSLIVFSIMLLSFNTAQYHHKKIMSDKFSDSSELKKKARVVIKKNVVKIYPNPSYGRINVSANTSKPLHFYIFDLEGTLIYQTVLNNKDKKNIDNLKKGTYMYDVFENDESIEEGKIIVK